MTAILCVVAVRLSVVSMKCGMSLSVSAMMRCLSSLPLMCLCLEWMFAGFRNDEIILSSPVSEMVGGT